MKKKELTLAILAGLLIILAACGKSAADRWKEQYDLGAQYLLEENYEEAVVAFAAAIEIEPKEIQAYTGLIQSYQQTGGLDSADSAVQSGLAVLSDSSSSTDAQTAFLLAARDLYTTTGDNEKLMQILELLLELDPDNAEYQSFLEREAAVQEFLANHEDLLQRLAQLCESGDDEGVWEVMLSAEYQEAVMYLPANVGNISYPSGTGIVTAIVDDGFSGISNMVYYGEMENGTRSGEGVQYSAFSDDDGTYGYSKFSGVWQNDLANGQGELLSIRDQGNGQMEEIERSGEYVDGVENGARTLVISTWYRDTETFHYTVENGETVTIAVSDDGENISAYAEENPNSWLHYENELRLFNEACYISYHDFD